MTTTLTEPLFHQRALPKLLCSLALGHLSYQRTTPVAGTPDNGALRIRIPEMSVKNARAAIKQEMSQLRG